MVRKYAPFIIGCWIISIGGTAIADKRSDFKTARQAAQNNPESCETIPYSDLFDQCRSQGREVHDWCDGGRGPVSCEANATGNLKVSLVSAERALSDLRDQKSRAESSRSSATDDSEKSRLDQEIKNLEERIREADNNVSLAKANLDQRRRVVEDTLYNIEKCIDYRKAVRYVFEYALDRMRTDYSNARGNPNAEVDESDAEYLRDTYEKAKRGHEMQLTAREQSRDICRSERP